MNPYPKEQLQLGLVPCACGCGELIAPYDRFKRPRRYIRGHHRMGSNVRKSKKLLMSLKRAERIVGRLGDVGKMPGHSYGLDAFSCVTGSLLAETPGSTCYECYARKNHYLWRGVRECHEKHMQALSNPQWCNAIVELITHYGLEEPWFRWHDSGDLLSVDHLKKVVEVATRTPNVKHWLPTREYDFVDQFLFFGGIIPENLAIRLSAHYIDRPASLPESLQHLPTSTVHSFLYNPVQVGQKRKLSLECRSYERHNKCGKCRACWDSRVKNISYLVH